MEAKGPEVAKTILKKNKVGEIITFKIKILHSYGNNDKVVLGKR